MLEEKISERESEAWIRRADTIILSKLPRNESLDAWIRREGICCNEAIKAIKGLDGRITSLFPFVKAIKGLDEGEDGLLNGRGEVVLLNRRGTRDSESKGIFKDGLLNGQSESVSYYYASGNKYMESKGIFKNGALNGRGETNVYRPNGNKSWEQKGVFRDGSLTTGEITFYDLDGNARRKIEGMFTKERLSVLLKEEICHLPSPPNVYPSLKQYFERAFS